MAEASGPREEINFWKSRTIDLSGISEQLHRADVRKVRACRLLHRPLRSPPACTRLWWLLLLSVEADEAHALWPCAAAAGVGDRRAGGGQVVLPQPLPGAGAADQRRLGGGEQQPQVPRVDPGAVRGAVQGRPQADPHHPAIAPGRHPHDLDAVSLLQHGGPADGPAAQDQQRDHQPVLRQGGPARDLRRGRGAVHGLAAGEHRVRRQVEAHVPADGRGHRQGQPRGQEPALALRRGLHLRTDRRLRAGQAHPVEPSRACPGPRMARSQPPLPPALAAYSCCSGVETSWRCARARCSSLARARPPRAPPDRCQSSAPPGRCPTDKPIPLPLSCIDQG